MRRLSPLLPLAVGALLQATVLEAQEIPRPALTEMEPQVQRQLRESRQELDGLLAAANTEPTALAAALGLMGQLYHAYDITESAEACYRWAAELAPNEHRWHYYLGLLRQHAGRRDESMVALERALELLPDDPPTLLRLADQARSADRLDRSEELYRRLLRQAATEAAGLRGLGQVATARGEHATAARLYERALAAQPAATRLHYLLAITYRRLGDLNRARQEIALQGDAEVSFPDPLRSELSALASGAAISLQRGYSAAFAGFDKAALENYRRAVAADPDNPEARRSLAGALADSGDSAGAIEQLRELLQVDPNPAGAHFALAERLAATGAVDEALTQYQAAVEQAPDFRTFRLALARALVEAGRLSDAVGHLRRLIEVDEHDNAARIDLGEVLLAGGDTDGATAQFQAVLAGDTGDSQRAVAHHGLGRILARRGAVEEASGQFERALRLAPDYRAAQLGLASLLGSAGRFSEAAVAFRRALELQPRDERARLGEATALLLAGDGAAAVARLEEGAALLPDSTEIKDTLARLLAASANDQLRDGARALAIAEKLFESQPTLRHGETLAMALAESGRFEEAVSWQERVVAEVAKLQDAALLESAEQVLAGYRRGEAHRLR